MPFIIINIIIIIIILKCFGLSLDPRMSKVHPPQSHKILWETMILFLCKFTIYEIICLIVFQLLGLFMVYNLISLKGSSNQTVVPDH